MDPKKMQEVLWDVVRADVLSQQLNNINPTRSVAAESIKLSRKVFIIHDITEEQFQKSYSYYTHNPDLMKNILDSLHAQQTRKDNLVVPVKRRRYW